MKPYLLALREKILAAYFNKEGTIRQLAPRFKVSARCVGARIIRFRRTGRYAPQPHGGGHPPWITPSQHGTLAALVQQYPEATRQELCQYFEEQCHVTPSKSSRQRTLGSAQK